MSKVINLSNNTKSYINKIVEATSTLEENLSELQAFSEEFTDLLDKKASIEAEIDSARVKTEEAVRAAQVDMELRIKANKEKALKELAPEIGFKVLPQKEYQELFLKADVNQDHIDALVNEAKATSRRQLEAALKSKDLEQKAATAELTARVNALSETLNNKNTEIDQLRGQIKELNEVLKVASTKGSVTQTIGKV